MVDIINFLNVWHSLSVHDTWTHEESRTKKMRQDESREAILITRWCRSQGS